MNLIDFTCKDFIAETASSSPAPGGGSVSALAGSLGAALAQMVIRLTEGKKAYNELSGAVKDELKESLALLEQKQADLITLVDEDTNAFNAYMAALAMPKNTDDEKAKRTAALQDGLLVALKVPLKTATLCADILKRLKTIATYGNKNAISDIGVATLMAEAGLQGAVLNVKINLGGINAADKKAKYRDECAVLLDAAAKLKAEVLAVVASKLEA